jgi:hypothetical protein
LHVAQYAGYDKRQYGTVDSLEEDAHAES